jgi:predicted nucleotidyltransferase component of viral defense system
MRPEHLAACSLEPAQRDLLEALSRSELRESFSVSGGSALAGFYLHHRPTRDLDLFTRGGVSSLATLAFLAEVGATVRRFHRIHDRWIYLIEYRGMELEVEFVRYPFEPVAPLAEIDGLRVDSLADLALNKLAALADRREPKDYVDLYFLLDRGHLDDPWAAITAAEHKFSMPGLRFAVQPRLLAVPAGLPPTDPPVSFETVSVRLREMALALVRRSIS